MKLNMSQTALENVLDIVSRISTDRVSQLRQIESLMKDGENELALGAMARFFKLPPTGVRQDGVESKAG
jgi:hypothetical protein